MKLILQRDQRRTITGKPVFILKVMAELTSAERSDIEKYKMGDTMLYTNLEDRGRGIVGAITRAAIGIEITVDSLVRGKSVEVKDILEMVALEDQVKEACQNFKILLDAAANFGGEEIIEF